MLLRGPDEDIVGRDLAPEGEGVGGQEVVGRGGVEVDAHLVVGEVGGGPELIDGLLDAPAGEQVVGRAGGLVGPEKAGGDAADAVAAVLDIHPHPSASGEEDGEETARVGDADLMALDSGSAVGVVEDGYRAPQHGGQETVGGGALLLALSPAGRVGRQAPKAQEKVVRETLRPYQHGGDVPSP